MEHKSEKIMRWFVVASWVLYATTFFPFKLPKEYLVQWVFVFVAFSSILVVCALAFVKSRRWKLAAVIAAIVLLAVYLGYWVSITTTARETQPSLASPVALGHILEQGALIANHLWGRGARLGAAQVAYFEIVMPIVQLLVLFWITVDGKARRST